MHRVPLPFGRTPQCDDDKIEAGRLQPSDLLGNECLRQARVTLQHHDGLFAMWQDGSGPGFDDDPEMGLRLLAEPLSDLRRDIRETLKPKIGNRLRRSRPVWQSLE